jgi:hypothetical protein
MAYINGVEVTLNPQAVREIATGPDLYRFLSRIAVDLADDLQAHAPHKTGAGARSIQADVVLTPGGWVAVASWDSAHFYLSIQDKRHPFAEAALQRLRFV